MRKIYTLFVAVMLFATSGFAQFRFQDNAGIGQKYSIDSLDGLPSEFNFKVHFNTSFRSISYDAIKVYSDNCQTQRGLQCKIYTTSNGTSTIDGGLKCNNYGGNGNPFHVANLDSLKHWLLMANAFAAAGTSPGDTVKYTLWRPSVCLFDVVNGDTTNQAFGCYPGMYKRVEFGFLFNMEGFALKSDISFTLDTYDPGTTGKTAKYKLLVYTGSVSAANLLGTVEDFYETGTGKKTVNVASALGLDYTVLSKKKVFIFVNTLGSDTIPNDQVYEPIVIFDDFNVSWGAAKWTAPAATAGLIYNQGGAGLYTPYTLNNGTGVGTVMLKLKDEGRIGAMTLINDIETPPSKFQFLDTLGVFANDGAGNYTVEVPYSKHPSVMDEVSGNYSKSYITIAAPTTSANDDIMVLMTFIPSQASEFTERLEINNTSVRFWWDVQTMSKDQLSSVSKVGIKYISAWSSEGMVYVKGTQNPVTLYNVLGQKIGTFKAVVAEGGINVSHGLIFVSTSEGVVKVMVK